MNSTTTSTTSSLYINAIKEAPAKAARIKEILESGREYRYAEACGALTVLVDSLLLDISIVEGLERIDFIGLTR